MTASLLGSREIKVIVSGVVLGGLLGATTSYLIANDKKSRSPNKWGRFCKEMVEDVGGVSEEWIEKGKDAWDVASNAAETVKEKAECLWESAKSTNGSTVVAGALVGGILGIAAAGLASQLVSSKGFEKKKSRSSVDWIGLAKTVISKIDSHKEKDEEDDEDEEENGSSRVTLNDAVRWVGVGLRFLQNTQKKKGK